MLYIMKIFIHQAKMVDNNKHKQWLHHRQKTLEAHFKYALGP